MVGQPSSAWLPGAAVIADELSLSAGKGSEIGDYLTLHPAVKALSFTGTLSHAQSFPHAFSLGWLLAACTGCRQCHLYYLVIVISILASMRRSGPRVRVPGT